MKIITTQVYDTSACEYDTQVFMRVHLTEQLRTKVLQRAALATEVKKRPVAEGFEALLFQGYDAGVLFTAESLSAFELTDEDFDNEDILHVHDDGANHPLDIRGYDQDHLVGGSLREMVVLPDAVYWRIYPNYDDTILTSTSIPISYFK
jgi:hypothetical protein